MKDQLPPELFAERPVRSDFSRRRGRSGLRLIVAGFILFLLAGGIGLYLKITGEDQTPEEIPTIKAEGPVKQRPEQPGGIDIPNQDVLVFKQLDSKQEQPDVVEHLLPPPEVPQQVSIQPVSPPVVIPGQTPPPAPVASPSKPIDLSLPPARVRIETTVMPPPVPVAQKPMVVAQASPPAVVVPAPTVLAPPSAKPATPTYVVRGHIPQAALEQGRTGFLVQLASFPDESVAQNELKRLQTKYAAMLGHAKLHLMKADLGAKGIYYRIESSPLTDTQATNICASLWSAKAGCMIVRP